MDNYFRWTILIIYHQVIRANSPSSVEDGSQYIQTNGGLLFEGSVRCSHLLLQQYGCPCSILSIWCTKFELLYSLSCIKQGINAVEVAEKQHQGRGKAALDFADFDMNIFFLQLKGSLFSANYKYQDNFLPQFISQSQEGFMKSSIATILARGWLLTYLIIGSIFTQINVQLSKQVLNSPTKKSRKISSRQKISYVIRCYVFPQFCRQMPLLQHKFQLKSHQMVTQKRSFFIEILYLLLYLQIFIQYHLIIINAFLQQQLIIKNSQAIKFSANSSNLFKMISWFFKANQEGFSSKISGIYIIYFGPFLTAQQFVELMQKYRLLIKRDDKKVSEQTHNNNNKKENGPAYYQEAIVLKEEPIPINGDKLKELHHRSVSAITFLNSDKQFKVGTGALISRDTILTAAHNIFDKELNCENHDFKFYIGKDGIAMKQSFHQIVAWKYPKQFKTCDPKEKLPFDYAIMKLKKTINFEKYLIPCLACPQCLLKDNEVTKLSICGFPCAYPPGPPFYGIPFNNNFRSLNHDDEEGKLIKLNQYGLARKNRIKAVNTNQNKICYSISTLPGQSGSPVVVDNTIIAVHVGGEINKEYNVGRIINETLLKDINEWGKQLNVAPFRQERQIMCQHKKQETSPNIKHKQISIITNQQKKVQIRSSKLKSLNLVEYANLMELDLFDNQLQQIDFSHCLQLTRLNLGRNQLQRIDLTNHKHLTHLYLRYNQLQEIDVRANVNLTHLGLHNNRLREIDLRANLNLTWLNLGNNQLQEMDLRGNINLTVIGLSNNQLQEIDVRTNVNLTHLNLSNNQLQEIEVITNVNLTYLWLSSNRITHIDTTENINLEQLWVNKNRMSCARLWIAEKVQEWRYIGQFKLSHQSSAVCRVQLICEGETVKGKAARIAQEWKQRYSLKYENQHNCKYFISIQ